MELTKWAIDPTHSEVQFKVKHLVITTVTGSFGKFSGEIIANENFTELKGGIEIEASSISTNNEQRDEHLKSADFFDVANNANLNFEITGLQNIDGSEFELLGDLTIRGVKKPIKLSVNYDGTATDPWGNVKAGFEVTGKINRHDFGLTWSVITEAGGALVSDEVKLQANIQLVKQA